MEELLKESNVYLKSIAENKIQVWTGLISLLGVVIALYAAINSKKAAEVSLKAQQDLKRPLLSPNLSANYSKDSNGLHFIVRNTGDGVMEELKIVSPKKASITKSVLNVNEDATVDLFPDSQITVVRSQEVVFSYKDIYSRKFRMTLSCKVTEAQGKELPYDWDIEEDYRNELTTI